MQNKHHSISVHFAQSVFNRALERGLDEATLLQESGLSKALLNNNEVRITPNQLSCLMQSVWRSANDEFLCFGSQAAKHGVFNLMAKQVAHSTSLRQVYRRGARFYNLINASAHLKFEEHNEHARFHLVLNKPELDPQHLLIDLLLLLWHRFPSWLIGQKIPLRRIGFIHAKPTHHEEYRLIFPCEIVYEQASNYLEIKRDILSAPLVQTQQNLNEYLQRCPLDWFVRQSYFPVYTRKVLNYLESTNNMAELNMADIAQRLHTTIRTLRRKLLDEGTSFQELKDNVRRDEAIHYLSQPNILISQVGQLLGFTEHATFARAFKNWTGVAPSLYRKSKM